MGRVLPEIACSGTAGLDRGLVAPSRAMKTPAAYALRSSLLGFGALLALSGCLPPVDDGGGADGGAPDASRSADGATDSRSDSGSDSATDSAPENANDGATDSARPRPDAFFQDDLGPDPDAAAPESDRDDDGIPDRQDNCPDLFNASQRDADQDGRGDACDVDDADGDGIPDSEDLCPNLDVRPLDADGDGIGDQCDVCPEVADPEQQDADLDGTGDACEAAPPADRDGDGRPDATDPCPDAPDRGDHLDLDGDDLPACDGDCDDRNAEVNPGMAEACNETDDDCDGVTDEGFDLQVDRANCGQCGEVCRADQVCRFGACARADHLRDVVMLCGNSERDVHRFMLDDLAALALVSDCAPDASTQAMLITRTGFAVLSPEVDLAAYIRAGGQVITEYDTAVPAANRVLGLNLVSPGQAVGGCENNPMPTVQMSPADPFWSVARFEAPISTGCGRPIAVASIAGAVALGGWSVGQVSLAYVSLGTGYLYLLEADWQDLDAQVLPEASNLLMATMIRGGRAGIAAGQCTNRFDDDADGLIDLHDPGCARAADATEGPEALTECNNGIDDDQSGVFDFPWDPGCEAAGDGLEQRPGVATACSNGRDDDADGLVDFPDDLDCQGRAGASELRNAPEWQCNNGRDDNGDGYLDFPDDWSCRSGIDVNEAGVNPGRECINGLDDDNDGDVDEADPGCDGPLDDSEYTLTFGNCSNGRDDDFDGLIDHPNDPECRFAGSNCEGRDGDPNCGIDGGPAQYFAGVAVNAPANVAAGWRECHRSLYSTSATLVTDITTSCDGEWVLMACRQVGGLAFAVAAMGPTVDVFTDVGAGAAAHTLTNDVAFYFDEDSSFGFGPANEALNRNTCDTFNGRPTERMCVHTRSGLINGGYRCGATTGLNESNLWERLIYTSP